MYINVSSSAAGIVNYTGEAAGHKTGKNYNTTETRLIFAIRAQKVVMLLISAFFKYYTAEIIETRYASGGKIQRTTKNHFVNV